jgi:hypothetical protein
MRNETDNEIIGDFYKESVKFLKEDKIDKFNRLLDEIQACCILAGSVKFSWEEMCRKPFGTFLASLVSNRIGVKVTPSRSDN